MAFVLKKSADFEFQIEGTNKIYTIPAIDTFNADELDAFRKLRDAQNYKESIDTFKEVLFSKCEGIDVAGLSDYQYLLILKAYMEQQKEAGSSVGEL